MSSMLMPFIYIKISIYIYGICLGSVLKMCMFFASDKINRNSFSILLYSFIFYSWAMVWKSQSIHRAYSARHISILQRSCSTLKFFLCVWLAFVLMLTIFHHPKAKTFCLASFLTRKKIMLATSQAYFFSLQESLPNNTFLP